jgi:hydrogenase nickel incorporation protein HypA/HybF
MHELSVAEAVIEQLERLVEREGAARITRVVLRLGVLSGVDSEALRFSFPLAAEGTRAEGAELVLEEVPLRVRSADCGAETEADPLDVVCAACGGNDVRIVEGEGLILQSAELAFEA